MQADHPNLIAMQYEMGLLRERNRLLSLENEQLLSELSQARSNYAMLEAKVAGQ